MIGFKMINEVIMFSKNSFFGLVSKSNDLKNKNIEDETIKM